MDCREVGHMVEHESQAAPGVEAIHFDKQYAQSNWSQYVQLLKRINITYWRNVPYNGCAHDSSR